ncbi:MAG: hypothetical protein GY714_18985 [Desulfobacterales bacterium]|nr:hypothetical protein [Desulfobacterales bacterium]MCP4161791.1 hypothetical protein [Deltaproteobacteria bacterium]
MTESQKYQLTIEGHLEKRWENYFQGFSLDFTYDSKMNPVTVFEGFITDQTELYGLISKMRDLGFSLIKLNRLERDNGRICNKTK